MVIVLCFIVLFIVICLLLMVVLVFNDDLELIVLVDLLFLFSGDFVFLAVIDFFVDGFYCIIKFSGGDCIIYYLCILSENGVCYFIIVWGNGIGGILDIYWELLSYFVSYGFVVVVVNIEDVGLGEEMIDCLNYLIEQNVCNFGIFVGILDLIKVGVVGYF